MANNNGYGNYDPRYDPRYQQQAYAYPRQNVEVRVPAIAYNGQHVQHIQQNYQAHQANAGYHHAPPAYLPYAHNSSPQVQAPQYHPLTPAISPSMNGQARPLQSAPRVQNVKPLPAAAASPPKPRPVPKPMPKPVEASARKPDPEPLPPIDYSLLLIDLAEKYFNAAYGTKDSPGRLEDQEAFTKLISTGLGCLEVCLHEWKLQPYVEASIRLRYSSILYQETTNYYEAEEALSKGISLCERYRLTDLKHNMQHLLTRVMYAKNGRAALRFLDGIIKDVETVQHVPWIYAMRFLRVSLALQMSQTQETLIAISQLKLIATLANSRSDHAVSAMASAVEALVHLNRASNLDGIEQAQRALAAARSSQLHPQAEKIPQLSAITFFVDLCCSIRQNDSAQASTKMASMQTCLDMRSRDTGWTEDGQFSIPLSRPTAQTVQSGGTPKGVIQSDADRNLFLRAHWLSKEETYTLGYVLSAAAVVNKNAQDGQRSEMFLQEAADILTRKESHPSDPQTPIREHLRCHIQAQIVFALCVRSVWSQAKKELSTLQNLTTSLPVPSLQISLMSDFLEAAISQGMGDTTTALAIYSRPAFSLTDSSSIPSSPFVQDLRILAALNSLLIIHNPDHIAHHLLPSILPNLQNVALENPSKDIHGAFHLLSAISPNVAYSSPSSQSEPASLLKTKQNLQRALQDAKHTANNQLCCITLNFMSWKFFRGVVGEQPQKSALSAQSLARKGKSELWISVADGLLAETFETQGKMREAEKVRREGMDIAGRLPAVMQREVGM